MPPTPPPSRDQPTRVLMVCLGNICRSPLARWLLIHHAQRRGALDRVHVDSCGTGHWHEGEGADPRTVIVAQRFGLDTRHTARQLRPQTDFAGFDLLLGMDRSNLRRLLALGAPTDRVRLMRSFDPAHAHDPENAPDVPDPYSGGEDGFIEVHHMLDRACAGLLDHLLGARA